MNNALSIRRAAGGSVVDFPPLFSVDGEILFIIRENIVHAYSTITGEWIRDLEGTNANIVNIQNVGYRLLVGCTVNGEIITWKYKSGTIDSVVKMNFPTISVVVKTFNIVPFNEGDQHGLLTWTVPNGKVVMIGIFELSTGYQEKTNIPELDVGDFKVAVSKNNFYTIAIIQNFQLFVANYRRGHKQCWNNDRRQKLTAVACHPEEETVAIYKKGSPINMLHHWHHGPVKSLAFTTSGSSFYSGGQERVLLGWNYSQNSEPAFLPLIMGTIVHIAVSSNNQKVAVSTNDNGIILINPQFEPISVIQNFTWVADDKTPWSKFPIGLKLNPRTSSIVLNGRTGQLQFYSTHTQSVSNLDTTIENRLSLERDKILYNTRITHSAINMDWLVTAESLDDLEHFPEVRLRFWKFDSFKQSYVLNTQIETPHERGVTALEFSSSFSVDNLLCASSGKDNKVKIWSLEETTGIDKTGKYWVCQETTSLKNLVVNSLAFSPDGSLLSVGYGNTLCVYVPETLRIKCLLSTPSGLDGAANKIKHVFFATREFSHFLIACTENRLLIWNLLTLRLHAAIKLSVAHIAIDPYTSLVAAFTVFNELYVFLPSSPYALYQRSNMPKVHGAVWIPRRYPKQQSLDVDWQAISQLYFLSENQELLYLVADNDDELIASQSSTLKETFQLSPQTPFGAMIAKNITNSTVAVPGQRTNLGTLIGDPTRNSVKALTTLQTHTMAPVSLLCYDFLASLVSSENKKLKKTYKKFDSLEDDMDDNLESENEDKPEIDEKIAVRRAWFQQETAIAKSVDKFEEANQTLNELRYEKMRFKMNL